MARQKAKTEGEKSIREMADEMTRATVRKVSRDEKLAPQGQRLATQEEFFDFAAQILGVPRESVSTTTAHESIPEWDSVMHLRLVMEIQDRFGVDIPIERVPDLKTLGDFFALL